MVLKLLTLYGNLSPLPLLIHLLVSFGAKTPNIGDERQSRTQPKIEHGRDDVVVPFYGTAILIVHVICPLVH
jgi:hypothetical protein